MGRVCRSLANGPSQSRIEPQTLPAHPHSHPAHVALLCQPLTQCWPSRAQLSSHAPPQASQVPALEQTAVFQEGLTRSSPGGQQPPALSTAFTPRPAAVEEGSCQLCVLPRPFQGHRSHVHFPGQEVALSPCCSWRLLWPFADVPPPMGLGSTPQAPPSPSAPAAEP